MAGYDDTRNKILETLLQRPIGTEIQPENHQDFALSLLDYIRSVELISGSTLIGIAYQDTVPVQSNDANEAYIAGVAQERTVVFQNFRDVNGDPLTVTTEEMEAKLVILIWNRQYWSKQEISANIVSQAENAYYFYNLTIRKQYASVAAMNADKVSPMGNDGRVIKRGEIVSVRNPSNSDEDAAYSYELDTEGNPSWVLQMKLSVLATRTIDGGSASVKLDTIQNKRDTKANWEANNPVLAEGEIGLVLDDKNSYKVGDGVTKWNDLPLRGYNGNVVSEFGDDFNSVMSQGGITNLLKYIVGNDNKIEIGTSNFDVLDNVKMAGFYVLTTNGFPAYHMLVTFDNMLHCFNQWIFGNLVLTNGTLTDGEHTDGTFNIICRTYSLRTQNAGSDNVEITVRTWTKWRYLQSFFLRDKDGNIGNEEKTLGEGAIENKITVLQNNIIQLVDDLESNFNEKILDVEDDYDYLLLEYQKLIVWVGKLENMTNAAVTTDKIADGAVTTDKIADEAVTPSKLLMKVLNELGDSEIDTLSQKTISAYIRKINPNNLGIFPELYPECFYITDKFGNILLKITKTETSFINIKESGFIMQDDICQETGNSTQYPMSQNSVTEAINSVLDKIIGIWANANSGELIVSDESGNIALRVNSTGVDYIGKITEEKVKNQIENAKLSKLKGKNIVTFGDSLSTSGKWQNKLAEITGANFDQSINNGTSQINNGFPTSYGGTQSWGFGNSGWQRAMNIVEKVSKTNNVNGIDIDVLFIMNVNDAYKVTTGIKKGDEGYGVDSSGYTLSEDGAYVPNFSLFLDAPAFFSKTRIIAETVFETETEALDDFRNNIIQRWGDTERSAFCCYTYRHYLSQAKLLTVNNIAQNAGTLTIHIGEQSYGIEITQGMTADAIIKAIENYDYEGCNDVIQSDGISILFSKQDNTAIDLTVDVGTTGIGYSITDKNSIRNVELFYSLYDTSDENFGNKSNWKYIYQITNIFGLYKGVIEYFQKNLPNTKIIFLSGPIISLPFGDEEKIKKYQNEDGSLSLQKIIEKASYMKTHPALRKIQQYVCQRYMIDYVDLANRNGISFFNAYPKYYNNADVHPRNEGYEHWGEWLAYNL